MNDPVQVRLSGTGGQGLITAGIILAEAAMLDGLQVVQTQTYGPEARLGSSRAEVILSKSTIAYPEVTTPDVLLCMSLEAARKFMPKVHADTLVVLDTANIPADLAGKAGGRIHRLPITQTAIAAGGKMVANTVALWLVNELAHLVTPESLRRAISTRVPERFRKLNEQAMQAAEALATPTVA